MTKQEPTTNYDDPVEEFHKRINDKIEEAKEILKKNEIDNTSTDLQRYGRKH